MRIKRFSPLITMSFHCFNLRKTCQGGAVPWLLCCPPPATPHLRLPAPSRTRAAGPGADTAAAITRVKEKSSHLFSAVSGRSSSHHPHLPAACTWRRVHHRCETISLSALTRRRNLSSLQHARGSLAFVWVWKISKRTPFSFSSKPATSLGSKQTFLKLFLSPFQWFSWKAKQFQYDFCPGFFSLHLSQHQYGGRSPCQHSSPKLFWYSA